MGSQASCAHVPMYMGSHGATRGAHGTHSSLRVQEGSQLSRQKASSRFKGMAASVAIMIGWPLSCCIACRLTSSSALEELQHQLEAPRSAGPAPPPVRTVEVVQRR